MAPFNTDRAKDYLIQREQQAREKREALRLSKFKKACDVLKERFSHSDVEVYLVGSVTRPYSFGGRSDIDIVLKNFYGDRFETWASLERDIDHKVEIILFEKCHFQDYVLTKGVKIL